MATVATLDVRVTALEATAADNSAAINDGWTLLGGCLVFLMQGGFTMLESGAIRLKNSQAIILKNLIDVCIGAIGWYTFGFALAFGEDNKNKETVTEDGITGYGGVVGTSAFFTQDKHLANAGTSSTGAGTSGCGFAFWFFQFTFCATCATIVSGALAERTKLIGFIIFNVLMTAFVYPIVVHWTWGYGWLYMTGYTDFAGSGIVHLCGGWAALIAAIASGPRLGRFPSKETQIAMEDPEARNNLSDARRSSLQVAMETPKNRFQPNSILNVVMGTFILWFGWFGFNGASTLALAGGSYITAGRCCANTTISGAIGGITAFLLSKMMDENKRMDIGAFANGILGGLVGITAGCNAVDTWAALFIGIVSGFLMIGATKLLEKLKIDDPLGAFPVHGACGIWGVIATGLFHMDKGIWGDDAEGQFGGKDGKGCLGPNIVGCLAIMGWVTATIGPLFFGLKAAGLLRVSREVERAGVDVEFITYDADLASRSVTEKSAAAEKQATADE